MSKQNIMQVDQQAVALLKEKMWRILSTTFSEDNRVTQGMSDHDVADIAAIAETFLIEDLYTLATKDKAARGNQQYVVSTYSSFDAIIHYRISNAIFYYENLQRDVRELEARNISEAVKSTSGIEIHPAAVIGRRFCIDHGFGTVIGETCVIGSDCYFLQKVTLGATDKTGKVTDLAERRHPTIGNYVEIGGFARIFGPIYIDDYVVIGPHCVITSGIDNPNKPKQKRVVIVNQLQVISPPNDRKLSIYGVVPKTNKNLVIYGSGFINPSVTLVDDEDNALSCVSLSQIAFDNSYIELSIEIINKSLLKKAKKINLKIIDGDDIVYITESLGLNELLKRLMGGGK